MRAPDRARAENFGDLAVYYTWNCPKNALTWMKLDIVHLPSKCACKCINSELMRAPDRARAENFGTPAV